MSVISLLLLLVLTVVHSSTQREGMSMIGSGADVNDRADSLQRQDSTLSNATDGDLIDKVRASLTCVCTHL